MRFQARRKDLVTVVCIYSSGSITCLYSIIDIYIYNILATTRSMHNERARKQKKRDQLGVLKCGILKITRRLFRRCSTCAFAHTAQAPRATVASGAGSERERERTNMAHSNGGG